MSSIRRVQMNCIPAWHDIQRPGAEVCGSGYQYRKFSVRLWLNGAVAMSQYTIPLLSRQSPDYVRRSKCTELVRHHCFRGAG